MELQILLPKNSLHYSQKQFYKCVELFKEITANEFPDSVLLTDIEYIEENYSFFLFYKVTNHKQLIFRKLRHYTEIDSIDFEQLTFVLKSPMDYANRMLEQNK